MHVRIILLLIFLLYAKVEEEAIKIEFKYHTDGRQFNIKYHISTYHVYHIVLALLINVSHENLSGIIILWALLSSVCYLS